LQRAHFLADVLHLAAPAFMVLDALAIEDCIAHVFRHRDAHDAVFRLRNELFAEFLQGGHFAFQF
jgi:hypothetical protein